MNERTLARPVGSLIDDGADRLVVRVYEEHARLLVGMAIGLGMEAEQAADIVQEAHLRLWRELRAGVDIRDPAAWTSTVAYRLCMDQHRLRRRIRNLPGRLAGTGPIDSTSAVESTDIWQLVDRLPERERVAVYLRFQGELGYAQIGGILGVAESAARSYVTRAMQRLRAQLSRADW